MAVLRVYATPKAGADEIVGWRDGELLVRVTAPPEDGKANAAVCKLLAKALGVPKSAVRVTRGDTSRHKTVEAEGIEPLAAERALGPPS
ncbi:MAG: DUF167 domain-containing protein [Actinomycetia bacterium]|nr:DUF167 domain-containing protein [Actinomycetes bacterium]